MVKTLILGIQIYRKTPIFLTIRKSYFVDRLSVANFAATIKPSLFDGPITNVGISGLCCG
jgi:hypothetical protein